VALLCCFEEAVDFLVEDAAQARSKVSEVICQPLLAVALVETRWLVVCYGCVQAVTGPQGIKDDLDVLEAGSGVVVQE